MLDGVAERSDEMATLEDGIETVREDGEGARGAGAADLMSMLEQGMAHFLLQVRVGASS